jgi:hypothetical protein
VAIGEQRCYGEANDLVLTSRSGRTCGHVYFPGLDIAAVGRDGTVIQKGGCSYTWYPQLLR